MIRRLGRWLIGPGPLRVADCSRSPLPRRYLVQFADFLEPAPADQPPPTSTACWKVGRLIQGMRGWVIAPTAAKWIASAHAWASALWPSGPSVQPSDPP